MTVKGTATAKARVVGAKVVVTVTAKVKITEKILRRTVTLLSASSTLKLSKKLTDLSPARMLRP